MSETSYTNFSRGRKYIAAYSLLAFATIFICSAIFSKIPEPESLQKICGTVRSYSFGRPNETNANSRHDNTFYFSLKEYRKLFSSEAITPKNYLSVVSDSQEQICFCVTSIHDWRSKTYGFWVNGKPIRTAEQAIKLDRFYTKQLFPLLAILFVGIAIFTLWRLKKTKGIQTEGSPIWGNIQSRPLRMLIAFLALIMGLKYFYSNEFKTYPFTTSGWLVIIATLMVTTTGLVRFRYEKRIMSMEPSKRKYLLNSINIIIIVLFGLSLIFKSNLLK